MLLGLTRGLSRYLLRQFQKRKWKSRRVQEVRVTFHKYGTVFRPSGLC